MPNVASGASSVIELAEVVSVDPKTWTLNLRTIFSQKDINDAQPLSCYCDVKNGGFVGALPEAGSTCYVMSSSDGSPPVVLGFIMPYNLDEGSAGGRPQDISEGDIILRSTSGGAIMVKRGDVISIETGRGVAKRIYSGRNGLIQDISSTYRLETQAGSVQFGPRKTAISSLGNQKLYFKMDIKRDVKIPATPVPDLRIELGDIEDLPNGVMRILLPTTLYEQTLDILGNSVETSVTKKIGATSNITLEAPIISIGGESAADSAILGSFATELFVPHIHVDPQGGSTGGPVLPGSLTPITTAVCAPYLSIIVRLK